MKSKYLIISKLTHRRQRNRRANITDKQQVMDKRESKSQVNKRTHSLLLHWKTSQGRNRNPHSIPTPDFTFLTIINVDITEQRASKDRRATANTNHLGRRRKEGEGVRVCVRVGASEGPRWENKGLAREVRRRGNARNTMRRGRRKRGIIDENWKVWLGEGGKDWNK